MKIAVVGAGSLGIFLASMMARAGVELDVIDHNPVNVDILQSRGAQISGTYCFEQKLNTLFIDQAQGPYDLVFLLIKQNANQRAAKLLRKILAPQGVVCTLQNGVPEPYLIKELGEARVMGGIVAYGCRRLGPSRVELTGDAQVVRDQGLFMGEVNGLISSRLKEAARVLSAAGQVQLITNLTGMRWSKLAMNASMGALSATLAATIGQVLATPLAMRVLACLADECVRVALAKSIKLGAIQGIKFKELKLNSPSEIESKLKLHRSLWQHMSSTKMSMLQDLEAGHDTETSYINGLVVEEGAGLGVPAPFNRKVWQLLEGPAKGLVGMVLLQEFAPILENMYFSSCVY